MLDRRREILAQRPRGLGWRACRAQRRGRSRARPGVASAHLACRASVNNLKTTSSRLIKRDFGRELRGVYGKPRVLVPLALYHHVRRRPLIGLEAVRGAAIGTAIARVARGAAFTFSLTLRAQAGALAARWVERRLASGVVPPSLGQAKRGAPAPLAWRRERKPASPRLRRRRGCRLRTQTPGLGPRYRGA